MYCAFHARICFSCLAFSHYQKINFYNINLLVGHPTASGILYLIQLEQSSDDYIQEVHWLTIQQRHNYYSICHVMYMLFTPHKLFAFHFHLSGTSTRSHSLSISPVTSMHHQYISVFLFLNSPFLWNSIPYTILQFKKSLNRASFSFVPIYIFSGFFFCSLVFLSCFLHCVILFFFVML